MSIFQPPPAPESGLARYRVLSPKAGVHVSPIQLGGMSIGDKWQGFMGSMNKEDSFKLLDAYFDNGGNFIDTANIYQDGSSEAFIGEWAEERGIRDDSLCHQGIHTLQCWQNPPLTGCLQKILFVGNNAKSLHISVKESLKNLRTDYIDLLYLHWWDWDTTIEELQSSGSIRHTSWVVSMANQYARDHGLTPFVVYQGAWNVMDRSFERDIIPMARAQGMALAPWNVLAAGKLRTDAEEERRAASGENGRGRRELATERAGEKMSEALEKVAKEVGAKHINSVAIAYLMQKTPFVFPILGGRKIEHLLQNLEGLEITLSDEQTKYLESIVPFDLGFPANLIGDGTTYANLLTSSGNLDKHPDVQPIRPAAKNT
ncbi:NADP-dependent oxidoreductase domain-containing protein [Flammula alnicola]|nr:NADP-dependent oxidoreductase domain-containing protein [Flammula alnicola]